MAERVITAPLAIIKVAGTPVGKMKSIRVSESFNRAKVVGLGQLFADEIPILSWQGTLSCEFFNIDFKKSQIPNAILRQVQTIEDFTDYLTLQENTVQIDIFRKIKTGIRPDGIPIAELAIYASVVGCFMTREGFDIADGQVSGRNVEFEYTTPIFFPN